MNDIFSNRISSEFVLQSGVYILFYGDDIVYVGQSISPFSRVRHHLLNGVDFDSFKIISADKDSLDVLESFLIYTILPRLNCVVPGDSGIKRAPINISKFLQIMMIFNEIRKVKS